MIIWPLKHLVTWQRGDRKVWHTTKRIDIAYSKIERSVIYE